LKKIYVILELILISCLYLFSENLDQERWNRLLLLQLADKSIKYLHGVIEDVLVKVDKLYLSTDFIILDMKEDKEVPLILGRPFLATGKTLIDVQ